eukprot:Rmarinus@m.19623
MNEREASIKYPERSESDGGLVERIQKVCATRQFQLEWHRGEDNLLAHYMKFEPTLLSLCFDNDENLWMVTVNGDVFVYSVYTNTGCKVFNCLVSGAVCTISCFDSTSEIFVAVVDQLYRFNKTTLEIDVESFPEPLFDLSCIAPLPDGNVAFTTTFREDMVNFLKPASQKPVSRMVTCNDGKVTCIAATPDGRRLFLGTARHSVLVLNLCSLQQTILRCWESGSPPRALACNNHFVAYLQAGQLYDFPTGRPEPGSCGTRRASHWDGCHILALSPKNVLVGQMGNRIEFHR